MEKEATGGIERADEMETVASHKRLPAGGQEPVNEEPKRPRNDDVEEEEMLAGLGEWRINWAATWSDYHGGVEKRTEVMSVTFSMEMGPVSALQIFSVKVIELNMSCWPIDVFGFITVRDSVDRNRNYIFERARDNCQTLTAEDSSLVLTGPIRAVQLIDPIIFEIELRVKGSRSSEDKLLSTQVFEYNCIAQSSRAGSLLKYMVSAPRSTLEFKYAHLRSALEARIEVRYSEGSSNFSVKFVARTASIDQDVTLMDSKGVRVALCDDGSIDLSRNVVVVEGHNGELIVGAQVRRGGDEEATNIYKEVSFTAARSGENNGARGSGDLVYLVGMKAVITWRRSPNTGEISNVDQGDCYELLQDKTENVGIQRHGWCELVEGTVELNVDVSFDVDGQGGAMGGILRVHKGG